MINVKIEVSNRTFDPETAHGKCYACEWYFFEWDFTSPFEFQNTVRILYVLCSAQSV